MSDKKSHDIPLLLIKAGSFLILFSLILFFLIFYPVIIEEIKFAVRRNNDVKYAVNLNEFTPEVFNPNYEIIIPADNEFSIIVPKIGANAKVIEDVDPYNSREYQLSLTKGVAHAKGSSTPERNGNTFLFAHSSDNFYNANRYNSVFYLLHRLEEGDEFYLVHKGILHKYLVDGKQIADAAQIQYLQEDFGRGRATLMTCWPPGTTINRLLIFGKKVE
jgi:LPXTG-site transpeptidase (sortase) family protein